MALEPFFFHIWLILHLLWGSGLVGDTPRRIPLNLAFHSELFGGYLIQVPILRTE